MLTQAKLALKSICASSTKIAKKFGIEATSIAATVTAPFTAGILPPLPTALSLTGATFLTANLLPSKAEAQNFRDIQQGLNILNQGIFTGRNIFGSVERARNLKFNRQIAEAEARAFTAQARLREAQANARIIELQRQGYNVGGYQGGYQSPYQNQPYQQYRTTVPQVAPQVFYPNARSPQPANFNTYTLPPAPNSSPYNRSSEAIPLTEWTPVPTNKNTNTYRNQPNQNYNNNQSYAPQSLTPRVNQASNQALDNVYKIKLATDGKPYITETNCYVITNRNGNFRISASISYDHGVPVKVRDEDTGKVLEVTYNRNDYTMNVKARN